MRTRCIRDASTSNNSYSKLLAGKQPVVISLLWRGRDDSDLFSQILERRKTQVRVQFLSVGIYTFYYTVIISERKFTFTFAICYRPSVRLSSVRRPSVYLSVTFVHPTQAIEMFGNVSTPFGTLAICDLSIKILRRTYQGNPYDGRIKPKRGSQI